MPIECIIPPVPKFFTLDFNEAKLNPADLKNIRELSVIACQTGYNSFIEDILLTKSRRLNDLKINIDTHKDCLVLKEKLEHSIERRNKKRNYFLKKVNKLVEENAIIKKEVDSKMTLIREQTDAIKFLLHLYKNYLNVHMSLQRDKSNYNVYIIRLSYFTQEKSENNAYYIVVHYDESMNTWELVEMVPPIAGMEKLQRRLQRTHDTIGCFQAVRSIFLKHKCISRAK